MWRQEEECLAGVPGDPDDEAARVQADGFFGLEKGFEDAEQLRRELEKRNLRS